VTDALRTTVADVVARGDRPILVGGCCTLLPGALAGARDAVGEVGLAYIDGHLDLYDGVTSPTGEPADMPIAVIAGHGPAAWVSHVDAPLVPPARLVLLGPRDRDEAADLGSVLPEEIGLAPEVTPEEIRRAGADATGIAARRRLGDGPFWVHVDVDALDQDEFPATDYLMPGGLLLAELVALLTPLLRSSRLVGLSVACYNPEKDPSGTHAARLVDALASAFG
jgi:arginase